MEFRKMITITLYTRQQKRHWCIEQSFGLCARGRGWDDLGEWHWNMYNIMHRTWTGDSFHTWYYTYFNAILSYLPTLPLSHRVHKTVLYYQCLFCCLVHRVIVTMEPIIQSEVSQKEKHQYSILMHIYGI